MKMKKIFLLSIIFIATSTLSAQSKYGFAYAVNTSKKLLYISHSINLASYSNCKDNNGYNTTLSVNDCLLDAYFKSVKIEAGSSYSSYKIRAVTSKNDVNTYNDSDKYKSEAEVNNAIKEMMAEYREKDFTVLRIEP